MIDNTDSIDFKISGNSDESRDNESFGLRNIRVYIDACAYVCITCKLAADGCLTCP